MITFQDQEQASEAKFAHDEKIRFLVLARRDKLLPQWAAERLGLSRQDRADLTLAILAVRDEAGHDEAVLRHVATALSDRGSNARPEELASMLITCAAQARQQLLDSSSLHGV